MKTVNVIRHLAFEDLGNITPVLAQFNAKINYIEAGKDPITTAINDCDLLIILGGPIGVYDEAEYPFINDEINLIQQRLATKKPLLGVCLGAQLMARSMGAKVYSGHKKELGWGRLTLKNSAQNPLAKLGEQPILHWHGDTFDLPTGATLLASNENYPNQAFAVENFALAMQFHPEVTVNAMEQWFIGHTGEISNTDGVDVAALRLDTQEVGASLQPVAAEIWHDWLMQQGWEKPQQQHLTFKGNAIKTQGQFPQVGEQAPDFTLIDSKLGLLKRTDLLGKKLVLNIFPSIDTPVCAIQLKTFSQQLANRTDTTLLFASLDLPFAYSRFCAAEGIDNAITASDYQTQSIAAGYGVKMEGGPLSGLYARAVLVLDENHTILHAELVSEVTDEPDYQAALNALSE
ncbi:glutamine amidotransferase [Motilimonas cestriensis]|uniref:Thiol peroxidase n=1 Tax=Motilimonas cestriensis TaxID=2742685 RepID=A0ABS8W9A9_9GAMM|nr:glutamine amidotransferase [Motilimonas cestriensis]MCE2595060.1 glutamine amidotransferase [Motilimonas cestriensis]